MNRTSLFFGLLLVATPAALAQEVAAGEPAPGLLAPPPEGPAPAPSAPTSPTSTPSATTPPSTSNLAADAVKARQKVAAPLTAAALRKIQYQETARRQQIVFRGERALEAAHKAERAEDYPVARQNYLFAAEAFDSISRATASYADAAEGLTRADLAIYENALNRADTPRAKQMLDEIIKYNPNNPRINAKVAKLNKSLANPNDTSLIGNTAVTPGLVKKVEQIQRLFDEAEQFRRTGQWDEADSRLKRILGLDPYNIAATKQLERIVAEKNKYADVARMQTRTERLREVEEKFYQPIENQDTTTSAQTAQPTLTLSTTRGVEQRLRNLTISLDFNNATIEEATGYLKTQSKRVDPEGKGVEFIILPEAASTSSQVKPITLALNDVPLEEALRYVCQLANVKYKVQDFAISILPFSSDTQDLIQRTFLVRPDFLSVAGAAPTTIGGAPGAFGDPQRPIAPPPGAPATPTADLGPSDTAQAALEAKGVKFPPGAHAVYSSANGQLTVTNTADQMEFIEEIVNAGKAPTLMVRIATKFVEINQSDLNDLTFNYGFDNGALGFTGLTEPQTALGAYYNPGTGGVATTPSAQTGLRGGNGITANSVDGLLGSQARSYNQFYVHAFAGGVNINAVIEALSAKRSFDLLSEPSALTKSGESANLQAIRLFPYPVSFDPPELVTPQTDNGGAFRIVANPPPTIIATTPTEFKVAKVGVQLLIKPQVAADNKTIDLALVPDVVDFEGFINYGSPIFIGNPNGTQSLLSSNVLNQPVFNARRLQTKLLIRDGSTVVMGGLIRDDVQTIDDKVPFLGDLPLIGRLFQSKTTQSVKRNLLVFVTANIYRNDGELLNPPVPVEAADVLTGKVTASAASR